MSQWIDVKGWVPGTITADAAIAGFFLPHPDGGQPDDRNPMVLRVPFGTALRPVLTVLTSETLLSMDA
jgi:hypothetical protein